MSFFILMLWQLHQCFWQFANTVQVKWKWNFEWNSFESVCPLNYKYNVMWCNKTVQIIHRNLYFSCFSLNYVEYRKISQYASYCDAWWHSEPCCDPCILMHIVSWSPCQYPVLILLYSILYHTIQHCTVLFDILQYYPILYNTAHHTTWLYTTPILHLTILYIQHCTVLDYTLPLYSTLH